MIPYAPMLLGRSATPPLGNWTYEVKYDGFRVVVHTTAHKTKVWSRNGYDLTPRFREFESLHRDIEPCVLDGELCVLDEEGRPRFEWMHRKNRPTATIIGFDVLRRSRTPLVELPIEERRVALAEILPTDTPLLLRSRVFNDGAALFRACEQRELEGIVAKRNGSRYEAGVRSELWLTIRTNYGRALIADRMSKAMR